MWHERLGHLNERDLKDLAKKQLVLGLKINSNEKLPTCETCIKGKHAQTPFPKVSKTRSSKLLELVHSDVCGPMRTKSIGGAQYFVTFIDDMSRWGEVYFLKQKGDIFEAFKKFKAAAETKTGTKIKVLRSDNGKKKLQQGIRPLFGRKWNPKKSHSSVYATTKWRSRTPKPNFSRNGTVQHVRF